MYLPIGFFLKYIANKNINPKTSINKAIPIVLDKNSEKLNSKNCQYKYKLFTNNKPNPEKIKSIFNNWKFEITNFENVQKNMPYLNVYFKSKNN